MLVLAVAAVVMVLLASGRQDSEPDHDSDNAYL